MIIYFEMSGDTIAETKIPLLRQSRPFVSNRKTAGRVCGPHHRPKKDGKGKRNLKTVELCNVVFEAFAQAGPFLRSLERYVWNYPELPRGGLDFEKGFQFMDSAFLAKVVLGYSRLFLRSEPIRQITFKSVIVGTVVWTK